MSARVLPSLRCYARVARRGEAWRGVARRGGGDGEGGPPGFGPNGQSHFGYIDGPCKLALWWRAQAVQSCRCSKWLSVAIVLLAVRAGMTDRMQLSNMRVQCGLCEHAGPCACALRAVSKREALA